MSADSSNNKEIKIISEVKSKRLCSFNDDWLKEYSWLFKMSKISLKSNFLKFEDILKVVETLELKNIITDLDINKLFHEVRVI